MRNPDCWESNRGLVKAKRRAVAVCRRVSACFGEMPLLHAGNALH
ncbi:MAG: hypothetical protein N838_12020 [Thiohalocapsa sp. PB-PSB1]|nr:MAG: hypothetical protein N838_12020 [Thiohalocapsa sp. PB-PSB1]